MRTGVYVDGDNFNHCGGFRMQYSVLRDFACREGSEPIRLNVYLAFDPERARADSDYRIGTEGFHAVLREQGFKVCLKETRWYVDQDGGRHSKANADLDLAVDMLTQAQNLDRVVLATGDGDFVRVVQALQNRGCRVEVIGLNNVSQLLRTEADLYLSGYLIPNLIPFEDREERPAWGEVGSRVRGWCGVHNTSYGFFRFLRRVERLHLTDPRMPESPYESVFFHDTHLPVGVRAQDLPNKNLIFEFDLVVNERGVTARNITLIAEKLNI